MPRPSVRRTASTALCAALLVGLIGPAARAEGSARGHGRAALPHERVQGADALLARSKRPGRVGGVITSVTNLVNAVLKADHGRLSAKEAKELGDAVRAAMAQARPVAAGNVRAPGGPAAPADAATPTGAAAPAVAATPTDAPALGVAATPAGPATPAEQAVSPAPSATASSASLLPAPLTLPAVDGTLAPTASASPSEPASPGLSSDVLAALDKAVTALLQAATSGTDGQIGPAVKDVVQAVVNLVAATLLDSGLPAPDLTGLPSLPSLPAS